MKDMGCLLLLVLLLIYPVEARSDTVGLLWQASYDGGSVDDFNDLGSDGDGNLYAAGRTFNGSDYDALIVKYSPSGTQLWARVIPIGPGDDILEAVAVDSNLWVYAAGYSESAYGDRDVAVVKYDIAGTHLWTRTYDHNSADLDDVIDDVCINGDMGLFAMGSSGGDYLAMRWDTTGGVAWAESYGLLDGESDPAYEYPAGMALDSEGSIYITGRSSGAWPTHGPDNDILTVKYDASGVFQWARHHSVDEDAAANAIATGPGDVIYCVGQVPNTVGTALNLLVLKYDSSGTLQWEREWEAVSNESAVAFGVAVDPSGNVFVSGADGYAYNHDRRAVLLRYSSSGVRQWVAAYTNTSGGSRIVSGPDGYLYHGGPLMKYTQDGYLVWAYDDASVNHTTIVDDRGDIVFAGGASNDGVVTKLRQRWLHLFGDTTYGGDQTGTIHVVATEWPANTNSVLRLDGDGDGAIANPITGFPTTALTVEFWARPQGDHETVISYATEQHENELFCLFRADRVSYGIGGEAWRELTGLVDGEWHHIALTWTSPSGQTQLFIDGDLAQTYTLNVGGSLLFTGSLVLGREQDQIGGGFSVDQDFAGELDEIRVWNRVLTPGEIAANMHRQIPHGEIGLFTYWNFDEPAESDAGGIGNPGEFLGDAIVLPGTMLGDSVTTTIPLPGSYSITNGLDETNYWVRAYLDANGNGMYDPWEPYGEYYANPLILTGAVAGVDIELQDGTLADTDGDLLADFDEVYTYTTEPYRIDSDGDGMNDCAELLATTSPTNPASCLRFTMCTHSDDQVHVAWDGGTGAVQYIERCADLMANPRRWTLLFTNPVPTIYPASASLDQGLDDSSFYRLATVPDALRSNVYGEVFFTDPQLSYRMDSGTAYWDDVEGDVYVDCGLPAVDYQTNITVAITPAFPEVTPSDLFSIEFHLNPLDPRYGRYPSLYFVNSSAADDEEAIMDRAMAIQFRWSSGHDKQFAIADTDATTNAWGLVFSPTIPDADEWYRIEFTHHGSLQTADWQVWRENGNLFWAESGVPFVMEKSFDQIYIGERMIRKRTPPIIRVDDIRIRKLQ